MNRNANLSVTVKAPPVIANKQTLADRGDAPAIAAANWFTFGGLHFVTSNGKTVLQEDTRTILEQMIILVRPLEISQQILVGQWRDLVSFVFKYFLVFIVLLHVGISMLAPLWIAKIFPVFTITEESSTFLVLFGCCNAALMLWLAARSEEGKKFRTLQGY